MTQAAVRSMITDIPNSEIPYPRSWIDRLIQWMDRIPGPSWSFYIAALFTFALLNNAIFWLDGSLTPGSFDPVRVLDSFFIVFFISSSGW